jgi:CheY-like chemotaxis protein
VMTTLLEEALREHVDHRAAVLSVDDSIETRTLITHFLDAKTARIVHAEGAKQALERTEHERVDLILMDLEMPGVSGFELAATFRGSQTHVSTPIIAVTGHDDPQIHRRCMDIGFTDILVKPFSRVTLQRIVERHAPRPLVFAVHPAQDEPTPEPGPAFGDVAYVDGDVLDLVPQFLENRRADVVRLRDALDASDRETVRRIGHAMRGSGGGYGFDAITRIGSVLEASAIAGDDRAARGGVEELDAYLDRVRVEVRPA